MWSFERKGVHIIIMSANVWQLISPKDGKQMYAKKNYGQVFGKEKVDEQ